MATLPPSECSIATALDVSDAVEPTIELFKTLAVHTGHLFLYEIVLNHKERSSSKCQLRLLF